MSLSYSAGGAMPLPRLAWDFDGTTAPYIGSATGTTTGSVSYSAGKYEQGLNIINDLAVSTVSNVVRYSLTSTINIDTGISIGFWVKTLGIGANNQYLFYGSSPVGGSTIIFTYKTQNPLVLRAWYRNATTFYTIDALSSTPVGIWNHVCLVVGNGNVNFYVNGLTQGNLNYPQDGLALTGFGYGAGSGNFFPSWAQYDDLRIFDRALTSAQVQSIYNQQGVPGRGALSNAIGTSKTYLTRS